MLTQYHATGAHHACHDDGDAEPGYGIVEADGRGIVEIGIAVGHDGADDGSGSGSMNADFPPQRDERTDGLNDDGHHDDGQEDDVYVWFAQHGETYQVVADVEEVAAHIDGVGHDAVLTQSQLLSVEMAQPSVKQGQQIRQGNGEHSQNGKFHELVADRMLTEKRHIEKKNETHQWIVDRAKQGADDLGHDYHGAYLCILALAQNN